MTPTADAKLQKVFSYSFSSIYDLYLIKVTRKNRTKDELDSLLMWLTGFDSQGLAHMISTQVDLEAFFALCPHFNPLANNMTGTICGVRIEEIENELMKKIRYMDKLVDELAKGKSVEKILTKYQ